MDYKNSYVRKKDGVTVSVEYNTIEECPKCKKSMAPQNLYGIVHDKDSKECLSVADYCNGCHSLIVSEYEINKKKKINYKGIVEVINNEYKMEKLNYSAPMSIKERTFEGALNKVSPQFIRIYNEALKAEQYSLNEIAGLGYRKALEFLIKDYSIYKNPEKEEEIKNTWMMNCLKEYVDNKKIKTLAEKAEWIGNDEAHYTKIQTDRDIKDMKIFIEALIYFISMELIVDDAETMENKK